MSTPTPPPPCTYWKGTPYDLLHRNRTETPRPAGRSTPTGSACSTAKRWTCRTNCGPSSTVGPGRPPPTAVQTTALRGGHAARYRAADILTNNERLVILRNLGFFSTGESLGGNNIRLSISKYITNPEARQYLLRQAWPRRRSTPLHLPLHRRVTGPSTVAGRCSTCTTRYPIRKDEFVMSPTEHVLRPDFSTETTEGIQDLLSRNLVGFYVIMEGVFFYSGFVMILSFHRQNRMTGREQFLHILVRRDGAPQLRHRPDQHNQGGEPGGLDARASGGSQGWSSERWSTRSGTPGTACPRGCWA